MFSWLADRFGRRSGAPRVKQMAEQLYAAIVAQARQPVFYSDLDIKDTIPGRFELVTLHMFIILDRLTNRGELEDKVAQKLVNVMFQDMDDVARETGVGDMGVGPRIKKLARSFRSRLEYYKQAIEGDERGTLPEAIIEIHFDKDKAQLPKAEQLAGYVLEGQSRVGGFSLEEMLAAEQLFADLKFAGSQSDEQNAGA